MIVEIFSVTDTAFEEKNSAVSQQDWWFWRKKRKEADTVTDTF